MSLNEISLKKSVEPGGYANKKTAIAKSQATKKLTRERDPWFNPYRYPASERGRIAIDEVLFDFQQKEKRKRSRKFKDSFWLWEVGYAL